MLSPGPWPVLWPRLGESAGREEGRQREHETARSEAWPHLFLGDVPLRSRLGMARSPRSTVRPRTFPIPRCVLIPLSNEPGTSPGTFHGASSLCHLRGPAPLPAALRDRPPQAGIASPEGGRFQAQGASPGKRPAVI